MVNKDLTICDSLRRVRMWTLRLVETTVDLTTYRDRVSARRDFLLERSPKCVRKPNINARVGGNDVAGIALALEFVCGGGRDCPDGVSRASRALDDAQR